MQTLNLFVIQEAGVAQCHVRSVLAGINEVLRTNGAKEHVLIHDVGAQNRAVRPWDMHPQSIEWYLEHGRKESTRANQLNGEAILYWLSKMPWVNSSFGEVIILNSSLYSGEENNDFLVGFAKPLHAVISVHQFLHLEKDLQTSCIESVAIHEVGHMFGLIPESRAHNVEESIGTHCTNRCIMRQGLRVPEDWIDFARDRIQFGAFCNQCALDLRKFISIFING